MRKIGIYGSINVGQVQDQSIDYIAVDQGVVHLHNQGIKPLCVIGDLDSLENESLLKELDVYVHPTQKDDTDTALAIQYAIEQGYQSIDLYGVTHNRLDHFMAVLCLLRKYRDIYMTIYDEYNKIYLLRKGKHCIFKDGYTYFSLFAYTDTEVTLQDCHYPLDCYLLKSDDPLCVSNQMNEESAYVEVNQDILFIQSR